MDEQTLIEIDKKCGELQELIFLALMVDSNDKTYKQIKILSNGIFEFRQNVLDYTT